MRRCWVLLAMAAVLASTPPAIAGEADAGEMYERARELAFAGQREEARALCREILELRPGDADASVLLGRLHAWDGQHDRAREVLAGVLAGRPDYTDARTALVDVELWADRPGAALDQASAGLRLDPDDPQLLYRKARALDDLGRTDEAVAVARTAVDAAPDGAARRFYRRLLDETLRNKVDFDYEIEMFDDDTDDWHEASASYRRRFDFGSVIWRVNWAERFNDTGEQLEVDAYPSVADKTYLYLNAGISSSDLFPDLRYSAEVYHNFPHGWEASLGFRRLEFDSSDVTIYTGTVAKYVGPYWISLRPNYVDKDDGSSQSLGLTVRRYLLGRYEYAEVSIGVGSGDKERTPVGAIAAREIENLDSFRIRGELRRRVTHTIIVKGLVGFRSEDLTGGRSRDSWFVGAGVEKYF